MESGWWRRKDNGLEGGFKIMMCTMPLQTYFCIANLGTHAKHQPVWLFSCGHICNASTLHNNNCCNACVEKER